MVRVPGISWYNGFPMRHEPLILADTGGRAPPWMRTKTRWLTGWWTVAAGAADSGGRAAASPATAPDSASAQTSAQVIRQDFSSDLSSGGIRLQARLQLRFAGFRSGSQTSAHAGLQLR